MGMTINSAEAIALFCGPLQRKESAYRDRAAFPLLVSESYPVSISIAIPILISICPSIEDCVFCSSGNQRNLKDNILQTFEEFNVAMEIDVGHFAHDGQPGNGIVFQDPP